MLKSQCFILDRMRICWHILCERSFSLVHLLKESWISDFKEKIYIYPVLLSLTSSLKRENSLLLKLVLYGNLLLMHWISLDYFCHHQGFVFTHANNNLFVMQLIMHKINSSQHHVFVLLCGTYNTIKLN